MARLLLPVCVLLADIFEATLAVGDHAAQRLMRSVDGTMFEHNSGAEHGMNVMALVDAWGGTSHAMNSIQVPAQPQVVVAGSNTAPIATVPASGMPLVASSVPGQPAGAVSQPTVPSVLPTAAATAAPSQGGQVVVSTPSAPSPNATDSGSSSQESNFLSRVLFTASVVGFGLAVIVLYYLWTTQEKRVHKIDQIQATQKDLRALEQSRGPYGTQKPGGDDSDSSEDDKTTLPEPEGEAQSSSQANGSGYGMNGAKH